MVPDYTKTLPVLLHEWKSCERCDLGKRRANVHGNFVFGEGALGGILFLGEGPGKEEEAEGRPFIGPSGTVLREAVESCGISKIAYYTNCVTCRSCSQAYSSEGAPITNQRGEPVIRDSPPSVSQVLACIDRLYEEIYLVDPLIIVALGSTAAELLLHRAVSITEECNNKAMYMVGIPGALHKASLTEKKRQWIRKVHGEVVAPVQQNMVEYPCIINFHPSFVLRNAHDERPGNPAQRFYEVMQFTQELHSRYLSEIDQTG